MLFFFTNSKTHIVCELRATIEGTGWPKIDKFSWLAKKCLLEQGEGMAGVNVSIDHGIPSFSIAALIVASVQEQKAKKAAAGRVKILQQKAKQVAAAGVKILKQAAAGVEIWEYIKLEAYNINEHGKSNVFFHARYFEKKCKLYFFTPGKIAEWMRFEMQWNLPQTFFSSSR